MDNANNDNEDFKYISPLLWYVRYKNNISITESIDRYNKILIWLQETCTRNNIQDYKLSSGEFVTKFKFNDTKYQIPNYIMFRYEEDVLTFKLTWAQ